MSCPPFELLSAFHDGETAAEETASLRGHLASCAACARTLRTLEAAAAALRGLPAPAMPPELSASLLALGPRRSWWRAAVDELRAGLATPGGALAAAALAVVLALWVARGPAGPAPLAVPAEVLMAAHRRYELTLPLSSDEAVPPEDAPQLAGLPEPGDVY